jgi:hypothetical protein
VSIAQARKAWQEDLTAENGKNAGTTRSGQADTGMLTEAAPPAESGESSKFISGVGQFVAKTNLFLS